MRRARKLNKGELTMPNVTGDARQDLVILRQIFIGGLKTTIDDRVSIQSKRVAGDRHRRSLGRLAIERKVGKANEALGVMLLSALGLHHLATEEVVERRKAARRRMAPGVALNRRQPLRGKLRRYRIGADL